MSNSEEERQGLAVQAAARAEQVLKRFIDHRPDDCRPADAIHAARAWVAGEISMSDAREAAFAAHAAARDCDDPAAAFAARAAGHAAATAHVAGHAQHAFAYADKSEGVK